MNAFFQKPLIFIINAVSPIILKVNERIRNLIIETCFFIAAFLLLMSQTAPELSFPTIDQGPKNKAIVLLFIIITIFSLKGKVSTLRLNLPIVILWYLLYLAIIASVIIHYEYFGILTLFLTMVILPVFFFVWGNRGDFDTLFRMVCRPFANLYILYSLFVLYLMVFSPSTYDLYNYEIRFRAITKHPNHLGILAVAGCICCIYTIFAVKHKALRVYYGFGVAVSGFFIMLASSRTSLLCLLAAMAVILLYSLRRKERSAALTSVVLLGVFILFSGLGLLSSYVYVKNVTAPTTAAISAAVLNPTAADTAETAEVATGTDAAAQTETDDSAETAEEAVSEPDEPAETPEENALPSKLAILLNRYNPFNKSLNSLTSGRLQVWTTYFKHLNLTGIDYEARKWEVIGELHFNIAHAHSQYLQNAHTMGFFSGLFELLLNTIAFGIMIIRSLRKGKFRLYDIFCIAAICSFYPLSLMEYIGEPSRRGICLLFLIAMSVLFFKPNNNEAEAENVSVSADSENE